MATESPSAIDMSSLPLLPLRDVVVFPHMVIPLFVGRPKSIKALDVAMDTGKHILLVAQKSAAKDDPGAEDLYPIGTVATVLQMLKLPDGTVKVLVEGAQRARLDRVVDETDYLSAEATAIAGEGGQPHEVEAMRRALLAQFDQYVKLNKKIPPEILTSMAGIDDGGRLADAIAAHLPLKLEQKQEVLEMGDVGKRLEHLLGPARGRGRHPAGREAHPRPREAADGEEPARVLPERAGQGDPEGAGRGRRERRSRRDGEAHQGRPDVEGGRGQGARRVQEAQDDVADVGRGDRRAQLHRHAARACRGARRARSARTWRPR